MISVDLNCDMGEGMPNDAELMEHVSSVNIACGFHAGDAKTMRKTVELAIEKGCAIGAHPSFRDLEGFGRQEMSLSNQEIYEIVSEQILALKGICESLGTKLHHVKPHGALYNMAAKDAGMSAAIAEAIQTIDPNLILYGLSGSHMISEAENIGLKTANEVFADRTYQNDGSLTPRSRPDALISDVGNAAEQVFGMLADRKVVSVDGTAVSLKADTICIHGDGEHALEFANTIHEKLERRGIKIKAL